MGFKDWFEAPLVLFCSPRGGSSLVAGVFERHGFWVGNMFGGPQGSLSGGYATHENEKIKKWMKEFYPLNAGIACHPFPGGNLAAACAEIVPPARQWMFKGPAEYYPVFRHYFPHMRACMVFRDEKQAVEAHVRRYGEKVRHGATQIVSWRYRYMEAMLRADPNSYRVDADSVVDGDLSQFSPVLAEYGLALDHRKAMEGISPEIFHR